MAEPTKTTVSEYLYGVIREFDEIEVFLNAVTRLAVQELSSPDNEVLCGITLLRHKRAGTVASSSEMAQAMDEVQYEYADGPCLTAARTQSLVVSPDLQDDPRWPEYAREVGRHGIRSALAVPFDLDSGDHAALNVYSREAGTFTDESIAVAQAYARDASQALALSIRLAHHQEAEADLLKAMQSRTTIDLAVGVIMGQNHCSQQEALGILKSASGSRNIKLRDIAAIIVGTTGEKEPATHFER